MKIENTISHHSPSQLGKPDANWLFEYVYLSKERRREIKVGYNAAVGTASHGAIQAVLTAGHDIDDAIQQALMSYDFHDAPADEPVEKRDKFREILPDMVTNGVDLLAGQFGGAEDERKVEVSLRGVDAPVLGFIDLCSSDAFCEIKTKAPAWALSKRTAHGAGARRLYQASLTSTMSAKWQSMNTLPASNHTSHMYQQPMRCCSALTTVNSYSRNTCCIV